MSEETEFRRFRLQHVRASAPSLELTSVSGRGVVMQITSATDITSAYTAISALRATGNNMPVQVFHTNSMTTGAEAEFSSLSGVTVHSIAEHASAVLESSFAEVLVVSPRTFAVADPASLFESAEYQSTGVVAFPSLFTTAPSNPIWAMLGKPCVDAHEQTAAAFVVNKEKAWTVLHVAEHLSGSFYSSMLNEKDGTLAFAAMSIGASITMAPASSAVGASYTVDGARKFCAHSTMLKGLNGENLFMVSANPEVMMAGSTVDAVNCLNVEATAQDDAFVASIVRLQAAVPEHSAAFVSQACPADTVLQATWEAAVGVGGEFYSYATLIPADMVLPVEVVAPRLTFKTNCGSFFRCATGSTSTVTTPTFFFNISARATQSANVRVSTPSYSVSGSTFIQWGNETYLRVVDHTLLRDECSAPIIGIADSSVRHNIVTGGWAVVAVSWQSVGCRKCTSANDIRVRIEYMGASSSAISSAIASIPMMVVAAIIAFVSQRWF
jgi:hypothetical protein